MILQELIEIAEKERNSRKRFLIRCCLAAGCISSAGKEVKEAIESAVKELGMEQEVEVRGVGCLGLCGEGPLVCIDPEKILYERVKPEDAREIVAALKTGKPADKIKQGNLNDPFFTKQVPIVLENSGIVDPERIQSYIAYDGYLALRHVLREMTPAQVIETISKSGLRGRGGAGYPTGLKWATVAKTAGNQKYVVCNADEGDPGAFMDRSVLESDPHRVLEGMAIAAYAVGANQGFIYVRAEYPLAISRLQTAIKQAKQYGLLGTGIFETPFNFSIELRIGAGAFVCGEETALIASVEGKRGTPRPRPPFPAEKGLWGCPTLINNVETFANVPPIIRKGVEWFTSFGTQKSKGTKVFALAGKIKNTGLIEVPMGTPLRVIVEEMGGGVPDGGKVKAVQTGGPSGGCIPASYLDIPVDYESMVSVGSIMGSGGMIVMDDKTSMVDVAKFFIEFCKDESCGKCIPCRTGTVQLHNYLEKLLHGEATEEDLKNLEELCLLLKETSLCGLGQTAPNPILSTLKHFKGEYLNLIKKPGCNNVKK